MVTAHQWLRMSQMDSGLQEVLRGRMAHTHRPALPPKAALPTAADDEYVDGFEKVEEVEKKEDLAALMQIARGSPMNWYLRKQILAAGLYRLWKHPFNARHYPQSEELKGVPASFCTTPQRHLQFVQPSGGERQIAVQVVDRVADGPPIQGLILYQDEHTYSLPIMTQVVTEHFVLQDTILLEHSYSSFRIDSRQLFAFWEPPCRCEESECIVVLPERVQFGGNLMVWAGCFVRVRCGPTRIEQDTDVSSGSTASGSPTNSSDEVPSIEEERLEGISGDASSEFTEVQTESLEPDVFSFFQIEAFHPQLEFPTENYHLSRTHTQVRGLERLNFRHVDYRMRTWTTTWGNEMNMEPGHLILRVRAALHHEVPPYEDLGWSGGSANG